MRLSPSRAPSYDRSFEAGNRRMTDTQLSGAAAAAPGWKAYPFALGDDPQTIFPAAEGDRGTAVNRYVVSGRLSGRSSGSRWAFLVELSHGLRYGRFRSDLATFALFDLGSGAYATTTERDVPRLGRRRRAPRLRAGAGSLDVVYHGDAGDISLRSRRGDGGAPLPFAYALRAIGRGPDGRAMTLDLELDATKAPIPVGGLSYRGAVTWLGRREIGAYFQSALRLRGTLAWGDVHEEVEGDCGWIDHQWSAHPLDVSCRYGYERKRIHLDDGIEIAVWTQFDRRRANRIVPYSGATAAGPSGEIDATTAVETEPRSFVRDATTADGEPARYYVDGYRLLVPSWALDLVSEPLVTCAGHADPQRSWSGPTRVRGTLGGRAVTGFGFHERTHALSRDFEIAEVLRRSLARLSAETAPGAPALADLAWEIDAMLGQGDHESAIAFLEAKVRPAIESLPEPHRSGLRAVAADAAAAMLRWWVRPPGGASAQTF